jgi:hypothetical protein
MTENCKSYDRLRGYQKDIDDIFKYHKDCFIRVGALAADISAELEKLSAFTEKHTAVVCPECSSVCCVNRHSYHTLDDIVYIHAIGREIPLHTRGLDDSAPCQFLGEVGCTIPRHLRPYRCNWYFCSPLLEHIIEHNSKRNYRFFIDLLEKITEKRQRLIEKFNSGVKDSTG